MRGRYLSREQRDVIDGLFDGDMEEKEILKKYGVTRRTYSRWFRDEKFCGEVAVRMECARRHSELAAMRDAAKASGILVKLAEGKQSETARKACMDLISLNAKAAAEKDKKRAEEGKVDVVSYHGCRPEAYAKAMAVLAEDKRRNN